MARGKKQAPERAARVEALGKKLALENRLGPELLIDYAKMAKTNSLAVELAKLNEIAELLWLHAELTEEARDALIVKAIDLFESIKPADGLEAMLAAQMVGTHSAAMECLRRAMVQGQSFEGRNANLSQAQRLMGLYARQLAALDKHRGKGQQKVTVEHIHVGAGGQAIVGNVETGAAAANRKVAPPQIEQHVAPHDPLDGLASASAARRAPLKAPRG